MQIEKDLRYWQLAERKTRITLLLVALALGSFIALAVGATWFAAALARPALFGLNVGLLLALAVFALCGLAAWLYARIAEREFDLVVGLLQQDAWHGKGRG